MFQKFVECVRFDVLCYVCFTLANFDWLSFFNACQKVCLEIIGMF